MRGGIHFEKSCTDYSVLRYITLVLHVYYALRKLHFGQIRPQNGFTVACITRNTWFARTVYYASAYPLAVKSTFEEIILFFTFSYGLAMPSLGCRGSRSMELPLESCITPPEVGL